MAQAFKTNVFVTEVSGGTSFPDEVFDTFLLRDYALLDPNYSYSTVTKVKQGCFCSDTVMTGVNFPNCSYVGNNAFQGCTALTNVILPTCTSFGTSVFSSCTALTNVDIRSCSTVQTSMFINCSSLQTVNIQGCVTINQSAFYNCISLSSINVQNCASILAWAFYRCSNLASITLPKCSYIGSYAFSAASSLSYIHVGSTSLCTLVASTVFYGTGITSSKGSIIVPASLLTSYKAATGWSYFFSRIFGDFTPTSCTSLTITADNVDGNITTTTIHYTAVCTGTYADGRTGTETLTGNETSADFGQNPSTTSSRTITISYTYLNKTATTTITQTKRQEITKSYTITTSGFTSYGFTKDTSVLSLDQTVYDGPYKSNNYNIHSSYAVAKITFKGYTTFTIWINSYAESAYDYTVAGAIDASTYPTANTTNAYSGNGYSTSASTSSGKYSNTNNYQKNPSSGLSESYWRKIEYATDVNQHTIYITYRKDGSASSNNDRGYFVVVK